MRWERGEEEVSRGGGQGSTSAVNEEGRVGEVARGRPDETSMAVAISIAIDRD